MPKTRYFAPVPSKSELEKGSRYVLIHRAGRQTCFGRKKCFLDVFTNISCVKGQAERASPFCVAGAGQPIITSFLDRTRLSSCLELDMRRPAWFMSLCQFKFPGDRGVTCKLRNPNCNKCPDLSLCVCTDMKLTHMLTNSMT